MKRLVRGLTVLLLVVMLILGLVAGSFGLLLNRTALDASFYLEVLRQEQALGDARDQVIQGLLADSPLPVELQNAVFASLSQTLEPQWMEDQVHVILASALAYLKSEEAAISGEVSLARVKAGVVETVNNAVTNLGLPRAYAAELRSIAAGLVDIPETIPINSLVGEKDLAPYRAGVGWLMRLPAMALGGVLVIVLLLAVVTRRYAWHYLAVGTLGSGLLLLVLAFSWRWLVPAQPVLLDLPLHPEAAEVLAARLQGLVYAYIGALALLLRNMGLGLTAAGVLFGGVHIRMKRNGFKQE